MMPPRLHPVDLALIVVYLLGITLFGLRFRKANKNQSLRSYFLADNTVPWWAIALSIVSAETSTLTIISVPGVAFTDDSASSSYVQPSDTRRTRAGNEFTSVAQGLTLSRT